MKRLSVTGPGQFHVADVDVSPPKANELMIAPLRVGVCGTDMELIDGSLVYARTGELTLPVTPGHEWVGRVIELGRNVTSFTVGDLVVGECSVGCKNCDYCSAGAYHQCPARRETGILGLDGALQQRMAFPASSAHRIPSHVAIEDAALIEPTAVAFRAVARLGANRGASILIVGGGTLGSLAAMLLIRTIQADVALHETRVDRYQRLRHLGVRAPREGEQFAYVLEAAGADGALDSALESMAPGAKLVVVGLTGTPKVGIAIDNVVVKDQTLVGSIGSPGVWPEVISLIARGVLQPSTLVTHVFGLDEFPVVYELLRRPDQSVGKVLVAPNGSPTDQIPRRQAALA